MIPICLRNEFLRIISSKTVCANGRWMSFLQAVCCSDHEHCCPHGYTCDVAHGRCNKGDVTITWFEKTQAESLPEPNVVCPGGQAQCPSGQTCCKLASGQWGCCPLPQVNIIPSYDDSNMPAKRISKNYIFENSVC